MKPWKCNYQLRVFFFTALALCLPSHLFGHLVYLFTTVTALLSKVLNEIVVLVFSSIANYIVDRPHLVRARNNRRISKRCYENWLLPRRILSWLGTRVCKGLVSCQRLSTSEFWLLHLENRGSFCSMRYRRKYFNSFRRYWYWRTSPSIAASKTGWRLLSILR